jgi:DNA polymerase
MTRMHGDLETYSECDLKTAGAFKYAEHPTTELNVLGYAFDHGPVTLWLPFESFPEPILEAVRLRKPGVRIVVGLEVPDDLRAHIESGGEFRAHHAQFERVVLNGTAGRKLNFPRPKIGQMVCTAAKMAVHGLPRALGDSAKALGTHAKDEAGRMDMLALSKPRTGKEKRWTPENAPERWENMLCYNVDDVEAEREVDDAVPDLKPSEQLVYELDQRMNDRGWQVDLEMVAIARALVDEYKSELAERFRILTDGLEPTQRAKVADWVRANGYPQLTDMQAETVKQIVAADSCPDNCKVVLRIYSTYGMKAVAKLETLQDMACADGKLRGMFMYHGAATGRWSSLGVQLQNLFRPVIDDANAAIEAMKLKSLSFIRTLYDVDPMKVFASCLRGMLIASPGRDLLFPDFAGIESRVNAWLWDEEWKLEGFRKQDAGTGPDNYKIAYARAFGIPIEDVIKSQRQIGKVMELALGYEGGASAFATMVPNYGINLEDLAKQVDGTFPDWVCEKSAWMWSNFGSRSKLPQHIYLACDGLKQLWREQHPRIVQGWKDLREAAVMAVRHSGDVYQCAGGKIMFRVVRYKANEWLCMRLPSGRRLWYFRPSLDQEVNEDLETVNYVVRYWGVDTYSRRYMKTSTYGGKLDENAVQAISRDLLVYAKHKFERRGYPPIGSAHDEPILEPAEGFGSLEEAAQIMCDIPGWARGLPVAVEGHRAKRYRK